MISIAAKSLNFYIARLVVPPRIELDLNDAVINIHEHAISKWAASAASQPIKISPPDQVGCHRRPVGERAPLD